MNGPLAIRMVHSVLWKAALWWCSTLKITVTGEHTLRTLQQEKRNYVAVFWHGSMLVGWHIGRPADGVAVAALVSQSKDGQVLSAILERWGYRMIRGSSHIGGAEAMQMMSDAAERGDALCITPDGPRGPRHVMKMGAIRIAQKHRIPLVLCGIGMHRRRQLRSWDKFEMPVPFSRVTVRFSEPITVPEQLTGTALDEFKVAMQGRLNELQNEAEKAV
jgi:lysophospholipid acyltransferase (LPLAT)-like uncharacterized protein